ncbi:hypothetical protein BJF88_02345 [Cellulosimicrobium sp. CUA-896]|nr:hypothetical protein BJF88_02345 [Cellulosimicrobium sp. CUA-896]
MFSNVAGWTVAALPSSPACRCASGWNVQASKRWSRMTGVVNVTPAPTRAGAPPVRYGSGTLLLAAVLKFVVAPSSRTTARAARSATAAAASGLPGRPADVGWRNGSVPAASRNEP